MYRLTVCLFFVGEKQFVPTLKPQCQNIYTKSIGLHDGPHLPSWQVYCKMYTCGRPSPLWLLVSEAAVVSLGGLQYWCPAQSAQDPAPPGSQLSWEWCWDAPGRPAQRGKGLEVEARHSLWRNGIWLLECCVSYWANGCSYLRTSALSLFVKQVKAGGKRRISTGFGVKCQQLRCERKTKVKH